VLYLGEINDTQELAWRRSIAVLEDGAVHPRTLSLFPEDRCEGLLGDTSVVCVKLSELQLLRPRQWGACAEIHNRRVPALATARQYFRHLD
jgi:hypothetical protein